MGYQKVTKIAAESIQSRYRDEFPVTSELIYLNHAAVAPLCRPAAAAMKLLADDVCRYGSLHYDKWMEAYAGLRKAAARLINASPGEIAILKNTSEGVATIAEGFRWTPGDRVVVFEEEFPANYYPWARLECRGVQFTRFSIYDSIATVSAEIHGARLFAISYVNYLSGYRVNLQRLGELCQAHNCFFFVDAIQGMGAFPIDVEASHIDALAADGHKWMLGPEGNAVLYVRRKWLDAIEPVEFGWTNPANYADYGSRDMTLRSDAGRYECGTLNTIGCFGQRAAIEFLLAVGIEEISSCVESLAEELEAGVRAKGYEVITPWTRNTGSGIVTFRHPSLDGGGIVSHLRKNGILAARRQGWIRMSPHFYITPEEIEQTVRLLPAV